MSKRDHSLTREPKSMQLNLTSMIDVIFLLLVFFVVTATFTPDEGVITSKLPALEGSGAPKLPEPPKRPLNIVVSTAGRHGYRLRIEGLPQDTPVFIKPDATVRWQHVVNAFNAAISARYREVSFARVEQP